MECFVKSFSSWASVKQATVLSSDVCLDSLEKNTSTVTVAGTSINQSHVSDWLILDLNVYSISLAKPKDGATTLTLLSPLDAFSRKLLFAEQPSGQTIGGFIADTLRDNWVNASDPVYAVPYMSVSNSDTTPFVPPDVDSSGLFSLAEYCRTVRRTYGVDVVFAANGNTLSCQIGAHPREMRQVSFDDGRSQLKNADFAAVGVAKITTIQGGLSQDWYLAEDGSVSTEPPPRRAKGSWSTISVPNNADVAAKVLETFAKNRSSLKIEFWSELDIPVLAQCRFDINGQIVTSYISAKRHRSTDTRTFYSAGELATTASEKLKGAIQ